MHRSLRRVVWLTRDQRETMLRCARVALADEDSLPWHPQVSRLASQLEQLRDGRMQLARDVPLTVVGLHLPYDALPVLLSDEDVDVLVVWGDLPEPLTRLARPDQHEFPRTRHRCPDENGGTPCSPRKTR